MGERETRGMQPTFWSCEQIMTKSTEELSERSCTLRDVARLAGVSTATVSRVLNGSETVTDKTRSRVMLAIAGLQYCPSSCASELGRQNRGIPRKRPHTIDTRPCKGASGRTAARAKS